MICTDCGFLLSCFCCPVLLTRISIMASSFFPVPCISLSMVISVWEHIFIQQRDLQPSQDTGCFSLPALPISNLLQVSTDANLLQKMSQMYFVAECPWKGLKSGERICGTCPWCVPSVQSIQTLRKSSGSQWGWSRALRGKLTSTCALAGLLLQCKCPVCCLSSTWPESHSCWCLL